MSEYNIDEIMKDAKVTLESLIKWQKEGMLAKDMSVSGMIECTKKVLFLCNELKKRKSKGS